MASPNDRLREVAYAYFEQNPAPALAPKLLAALDKEEGEFVRPALVRALAAMAKDPKVVEVLMRDAMRGVDYFRSTVIEAIGDYKIAAAMPRLVEIAKLEGPLQDDAATAIGKIGDKNQLGTLAAMQQSAPKETQPAVAAAICLLGTNCSAHIGYLEKTLTFADTYPGYQDLLRGAAAGLGNIARQGNDEALRILFDVGIPSQDPVRAPVTLAIGLVALRNTPLMLKTLAGASRSGRRRRHRRRGLRHARGRSRGGAVLRRGPQGLLGRCRRLADEKAVRTADHQARLLEPGTGEPWKPGTDMDYKSSGVDIDAGNETVRRIKRLAKATFTPGVLSDIGSFGGLFKLDTAAYKEPVLVSSADGVGTKLKVAFMANAAPHHRRGSRQSLRQRHPGAGRDAAVLPRLPRDRPAVAGRGGADRRRPREGLHGQRLRAARRRDGRDAGLLRRRRIRRGRLHRRRRRSRADRRRAFDRRSATC